jgi:50S ribosomal protein L16 3-hydroxylase
MEYPELSFPGPGGAQGFLAREWQRAPLLMRQALPGFVNPLPADELAGLACESDVEARILIERPAAARWEVLHGPFDAERFAALPPDHWTLLVQDVDKHIPEIGQLLERFRFLPQWRLDDIMISYAADQGSVGPHIDEYDVFLIQAEGRRRWRISTAADAPSELIPDLEVKVLRQFQPDQDWVLEPGDVLYLPPGVPHWGVAEGPCQTWSVGLRAPAWRELADDWLALVAERCMPSGRWRDRHGQVPADPAELDLDTLSRMRETIVAAVGSASPVDFQRWLGAFLTEPKPNLELEPLDHPCTGEEVAAELERQGWLDRDGRSRLLLSPPLAADKPALLFANGAVHETSARLQPLLSLLANQRRLDLASLRPWLQEPEALRLLKELVSAGHYLWPPGHADTPG